MDGKWMINSWYKVKVAHRNAQGWVFGGGIVEKNKPLKQFYSLKDLEQEYPNLANDCKMIFKYILPRPYIMEDIINQNPTIRSKKIDQKNLPFEMILRETYDKINGLENIGLFPIYETEKGEMAILDENLFLSIEAKKWANYFKKEIILKDFGEEGAHKKFVKIEEELQAKEYWINVLTNKRNLKARMKSYEEYINVCLEYSSIKLEGIDLEEGEFPLLASFEKIEINYDVAENRIKQFNDFKPKLKPCLIDCGNNTTDMEIIAHFPNTDLYLAGNSRKKMNEVNTQDRAILYITDKVVVALLNKSIDYFGCSCL